MRMKDSQVEQLRNICNARGRTEEHLQCPGETGNAPSIVSRQAIVVNPRLWLLVPSSFLFLVVRPGAPSSVLAPSSDARSP